MCEQHGQRNITKNLSERRKPSPLSAPYIVKMSTTMVDKHELTGAVRKIREDQSSFPEMRISIAFLTKP